MGCVHWKNKPEWFKKVLAQATGVSQKFFIAVKEE